VRISLPLTSIYVRHCRSCNDSAHWTRVAMVKLRSARLKGLSFCSPPQDESAWLHSSRTAQCGGQLQHGPRLPPQACLEQSETLSAAHTRAQQRHRTCLRHSATRNTQHCCGRHRAAVVQAREKTPYAAPTASPARASGAPRAASERAASRCRRVRKRARRSACSRR